MEDAIAAIDAGVDMAGRIAAGERLAQGERENDFSTQTEKASSTHSIFYHPPHPNMKAITTCCTRTNAAIITLARRASQPTPTHGLIGRRTMHTYFCVTQTIFRANLKYLGRGNPRGCACVCVCVCVCVRTRFAQRCCGTEYMLLPFGR
jgi:hypothetical protein